jgi:hypothetical protein
MIAFTARYSIHLAVFVDIKQFFDYVRRKHTALGILDLQPHDVVEIWIYSASDDRSKFVLQVMGKNPRLMIIPIKDSIKPKEIIEIPLKK